MWQSAQSDDHARPIRSVPTHDRVLQRVRVWTRRLIRRSIRIDVPRSERAACDHQIAPKFVIHDRCQQQTQLQDVPELHDRPFQCYRTVLMRLTALQYHPSPSPSACSHCNSEIHTVHTHAHSRFGQRFSQTLRPFSVTCDDVIARGCERYMSVMFFADE